MRPLRSSRFSVGAAKERREGAGVALEQHVRAAGAVGTEVGLGVRSDRAPAQRRDAGALPLEPGHEELDAAVEKSRPVAAHRGDGGALDHSAAGEHRVGGAAAFGVEARAALAELPREIAPALAPGPRRELAAVPAKALELPREAVPELRRTREVHRMGTAEQSEETHLDAASLELARELECDRAAGAEAGDDAR